MTFVKIPNIMNENGSSYINTKLVSSVHDRNMNKYRKKINVLLPSIHMYANA